MAFSAFPRPPNYLLLVAIILAALPPVAPLSQQPDNSGMIRNVTDGNKTPHSMPVIFPDISLPVLPSPASSSSSGVSKNPAQASNPSGAKKKSEGKSKKKSTKKRKSKKKRVVVPSFPAKLPTYSIPASQSWCVVNASSDPSLLQEAFDFACGFGADCRAIQPGEVCFYPSSLVAHASYALNSYWQKTKHTGGRCAFEGIAFLTQKNPSYERCVFEYKD